MNTRELEEIVTVLKEELQEYFAWVVEELGYEYYISDRERASDSLESDAEAFMEQRLRSDRRKRWERDRYAFHQHPNHPSVYGLLDVEDLEIVHYPEELVCEHDKIAEREGGRGGEEAEGRSKRYEQDFGVLIASLNLGWMYRLDFCEMCGIVEVWSMEYNPAEIDLYDSSD